jgi:hypothetical protein
MCWSLLECRVPEDEEEVSGWTGIISLVKEEDTDILE